MSRAALIDWLQQRLGFEPESLGARLLDASLDDARAALGHADDAALAAAVSQSPAAAQAFVDAMVVGETWFFRHPEQFEALRREARRCVAEQGHLRVLSLPCASGEEAWSILFTLLDEGLGVGQFSILGIDVSQQALALARKATYRPSALRGQAPPLWLHPCAEGWCVDPEWRQQVIFRHGNIATGEGLSGALSFDVIFCRNLLIYLHAEARTQLLRQLLDWLAPGGLILAGQAEVLSSLHPELVADADAPLAYRRRPPRAAPPPPRERVSPTRAALNPLRATPLVTNAAPPEAAARHSPLTDARILADRGDLAAARALLQRHVEAQAEDAAAWHLLGLVDIGLGQLEAADAALGRSLYLDPAQPEVLAQRAALAQRMGAGELATRLRGQWLRMREAQS